MWGAFVSSFKSVEIKFVFFIPAVRVAAYNICQMVFNKAKVSLVTH